MRKILTLVLFFAFATSSYAFQSNNDNNNDKGKKKGRPDLPGNLYIDLGFNSLLDAPRALKTKAWGSKTINFYYYYSFPIGNSHFSFSPGFGVGLEKFSFDSTVTIVNTLNDEEVEEIQVVGLSEALPNASIKKTKLAANYIDIPVEFRFHVNKDDHGRGFRAAIGAKGGILIGSHTKVKYKERKDIKTSKQQDDFNLERFRYGVYARIGFPGIKVYGYYGLSDLFKKNKGPLNTTASAVNIGISITGF